MARAYVESTALELDKHVLISKIQATEGKQYTFCPLTDIAVGKTPVDTGLSKRKRRTLPVVGTRPEEGVSGGVGTRAGDSHCAGLERGAVAPSPCARGLGVAPACCSHHWCGHGTHKRMSIIRHARPAPADTAAALSPAAPLPLAARTAAFPLPLVGQRPGFSGGGSSPPRALSVGKPRP